MIILFLYSKRLVLTLVSLMLVCGVQGIVNSQEEPSAPTTKVLSGGEMRERVLPLVVLIESNSGSGSGVVVGTPDSKMVILTNEHITRGADVVTVYFIASDSEGRYIRDRGFYLELSNKSMLRRLGYITNGRVIAEDSEADVAIIRPSGRPRTADWYIFDKQNLDPKVIDDVYNDMKKGEQVHFFGHPADQGLLWQWNAGHFQAYDERNLFYEGRPWKGNSGGPVVNKDGALIGITKSIDDVTKAWAVSLDPLIALVIDLKEWYIFSIFNETKSPIVYEVNWSEGDTWEQNFLEPGKWHPHHQPTDTPGVITPKIRYVSTQQQNPQVPANTDTENIDPQSEDALVNTIYTEHEIKNVKRQLFGSDIQERIEPKIDGYNYRFIDAESKKIELQEPRQTIWIANHTTETQRYKIKWSASRLDEENYILAPGKTQPHWNTRTQTELSANYPKIQIDYAIDNSVDNTKYKGTIEKLIITTIDPEFFPIDTKTDEHTIDIGDIKKSTSTKYGIGYYHFHISPESGAFEIRDGLPIPEVDKSSNWWKRKSRFFGILVPEWLVATVCLIISGVIGVTIGITIARRISRKSETNDE